MCLLIVASRVNDDFPLIVGANRDERLARPAKPMDVLHAADPRVIGGRDLVGGGTWLAVNELGVVAAITNQPTPGGPDPTKRSRGEWVMSLAAHGSAAVAVEAFVDSFRPDDYNPGWLVVADRTGAFTIVMTDGAVAVASELAAGVHVFENRPPDAGSPLAVHVRSLVGRLDSRPEPDLVDHLGRVLADHHGARPLGESADPTVGPTRQRAACMHGEKFGTRWSGIAIVAASAAAPSVYYADGAPCVSQFTSAAASWA